jgi:hypothetical protein
MIVITDSGQETISVMSVIVVLLIKAISGLTWAADAIDPSWVPPRDISIGKSMARSLMQPQSLAMRLLPAGTYATLVGY